MFQITIFFSFALTCEVIGDPEVTKLGFAWQIFMATKCCLTFENQSRSFGGRKGGYGSPQWGALQAYISGARFNTHIGGGTYVLCPPPHLVLRISQKWRRVAPPNLEYLAQIKNTPCVQILTSQVKRSGHQVSSKSDVHYGTGIKIKDRAVVTVWIRMFSNIQDEIFGVDTYRMFISEFKWPQVRSIFDPAH